MRIVIPVAFLAIGFPLTANSQVSNAERDVLAASDERLAAVFRRDEDALDRLQEDDFVLVQDGVILKKPAQIARVLAFDSPDGDPTRSFDVHNITFERNIAIVTGVVTITVNFNEFSTAFTEVWIRRAGGWRAKAAHYSTIDAAAVN